MSEVSPCSNHVCNAHFDKAVDEYITCSLCLKPAYCSDECRLLDWPAHGCPNVHQTDDIKMGLAVPYFYEDLLTAEELADESIDSPIFQSYQVMYCNANRTISEYPIPALVEKYAVSKDDETPLARGMNPDRLPAGLGYALVIGLNDKMYQMDGEIPKDMIYLENANNPKARAISGGGATRMEKFKNILKGGARRLLHHQSTSYIFWPDNTQLIRKNIQVPLKGNIGITLIVGPKGETKKNISFVGAGYTLPSTSKSDVMAAGRKIQQMFRSQLELKFKGSGLSTKNMYVRRYSDSEGNGVILTFVINPGDINAQLVDIEYVTKTANLEQFIPGGAGPQEADWDDAPAPPPPDDNASMISSRFACNVRDFEDIMGLSMALDTFIASPPLSCLSTLNLQDLESKSAIIKEYVHKMQSNQGEAPENIPPEVDTAIMTAVNVMYEPIGMSQSQWDKKAMGTFDNFKADVDRIIANLKDVRTKSAAYDPSKVTGKFKRGVRNIFQKKFLIADLDRILKAIDKRTGSFGEDGASQETKDKWNALRESVVQAKRSGVM